MNTIRNLDEASRRARQEAIGLFTTHETPTATSNQQDDTMQETSVSSAPTNRTMRASQILDHLSKPPTFREVAVYEAKKAAVWAPMLFSTLVGAFWVNKRFILKAATRL